MIRKLLWPLALALGLQAAMMTLLGQLALGEGLPRLPAATRCVNPGGTGGCFARIQDAINASSAGDRVNVASGVYTEHITMKEGVSVYGEGIFLTILDGGYAAAQSMVTFPPGVSASTVLSGVMIAGGGDGGTTAFVQGGGLNIEYASPSITNVLIINNTALRGGGVFVNSGSPTFDQALVWTNRAQDGGGFYLQNEADVTIRGNVFDPNVLAFGTVFSNTATNEGGGLFISPNVTATLTGLRVISNAASTGGGFYMVSNPYRVAIGLSDISFNQASTLGGGFYGFRATNLLIGLNFINFNTAANEGGAMAFSQSGGLVQGNIFNGNRSTGGSGGAVSMFSTSTGPALKGNWFENNSASAGGGLNLETGAMPLVEANTFVTNTAALGGGIYMFQAGAVTVTNNIVANNIATGGGNAGAGIAVVESPA
ncbi:MAG: right-handed parallel beta-helix repeat-containing protein, partial [Anaerolineae bacterium]